MRRTDRQVEDMGLRLGLVLSGRESSATFAQTLTEVAGSFGIAVVDVLDGPSMVIAVGGDGTVLEAAQTALTLDVPLLGFNLGTIGFLAEAEPDRLTEAIRRIADGDFRVEDRLTVEATFPDGPPGSTGLNDVVVEKIDSQRLVVLAVEVDGEGFLTHRADGIVVASSTGSTAYAFSAGGPLVDPRLPALLFTPVAPHSLFNRTLVLPAEVAIKITVVDDRPVRVSVDGREVGSLDEGGSVVVQKGPRPVRFIKFDSEGFPSRVTRKFDLR